MISYKKLHIIHDIIYDMSIISLWYVYLSWLCFSSNAGISAPVADPIVPAASDSESDRSLDPDAARDYADQFAYHDDPDSPGSVNDENSDILAAILECIPACIQEADFKRLSDLQVLPHTEPV